MASIDVVSYGHINRPRKLSDRFRNLVQQMASENGVCMELVQRLKFEDFLGFRRAITAYSRATGYLRIDDDDDSIDYIRKYRIMVTAINFQREVVALRPVGHPDRALSCAKLARSLMTRDEQTHDVRPQDEANALERETISLRPAGHPDRASSCASLADSIQIRFNRICARLGLPHKVVDLQREAVTLRSEGHVDHEQSRVNLVRSLWMLYKYSRSSHHHMDEAIALEREVLALHPAGPQHHALSCSELASSLRLRQDHISKYHILITAIDLQREVVALRPAGHPDRALSCANLANSLQKLYERMGKDLRTHYDRTGNFRFLITAVDLQREVVALRPADHLDRALSCASLASSLWVLYNCKGANHHMDEAIAMEREVLALQPAGPIDHASRCASLADVLRTHYDRTRKLRLLIKAVDLQREVVALRPADHPDHALSCAKLARSLMTHYKRTYDVRPLDEAITLEREAVSLRPAGHPDRASSCASLAKSLRMRCDRTFDLRLLTEAVDLQREVVGLQPARHPDRKRYSEELANSLQKLYERTGDDRLLDETINFQREVLAFHPREHQEHGLHCRNLSMSLWTRYKRTGDDRLLDETIDLQREAINLLGRRTNVFRNRSIRALSYASLANSLWALYERSGNDHHLNEAIDLDRKALALRPPGDPHRASSCASLAISLMTRYERTREDQLRIEAISLEREAIALRPQGHPDRPLYCVNLAVSLMARYEHSGDEDLLHQVVALANEIVAVVSVHAAWRVLSSLAWVHLQYTSSFYNVSEAVACLLRSLEKEPDNIFQAVSTLRAYIDDTWDHRLVHERVELCAVYQRFAALLPLLASPVLDLQPQLKALRECSHIGSDAFVNAALAGRPTLGVETLELAQGVIWSQSVHRRDPQFKDVPDHLASKLQDVLKNMEMRSASETCSSLAQRDAQHSHSSYLYTLVREIRTLPGLDRFMLGETFETLRAAAIHHPVVVLVSARDHHYAFAMAPWLTQGSGLVSLDLRDEDLQNLLFTTGATRPRRSGIALEETQASAGRAPLKKTACSSSGLLDGQLTTLWHKVVKPVLDHLGLQASGQIAFIVDVR
jgi:tetratricopeptide (TPR) repeat protein